MGLGLFLAFLWICHVLPLSVSVSAEENTTCPESFDCGSLTQVTFPFFDWSYPSDCGFCMLDCEAEPRIAFELSKEKWFSVKSISHDSVITLHDNELEHLLGSLSCESFNYDIRLPNYPSISYSILNNITLYRCTRNPHTRQLQVEFFSGYANYDTCDNFTIYYQMPGYDAPEKVHFNRTIQTICTAVTLPMFPENIFPVDTLFQLLTADFQIQWHLPDDCFTCGNKGHECRTNWSQPGDPRCVYSRKGTKGHLVIIMATAASAGGLAILVILAYLSQMKYSQMKYSFLRIWSKSEKFQNVEDFLKSYGSLAPKRYHYSAVKKMTNSFKAKLGQGGYGCVYKGKLQDGSPVAVKVLKESKGSGDEFINEVASISRTSHVNIVTLMGFCFQGCKRALIYEFMPNGSLDKFIHSGRSSTHHQLRLQELYKISIGIARGLEYLHRGCNTRILHFDIKPHNILLDKDFTPKISDFGLAKLCPGKESIVSMLSARGTVGYIAPEVFCKTIGGVSHKSDVYSYGMMVFEMVGVRKDTEVGVVDHSSDMYFPDWIYKRLDQIDEFAINGVMNEEEKMLARKMIIVSLWCIQTHPSNRPAMTKVVEMLEGSLEALQIPPLKPPEGPLTVDLTSPCDSVILPDIIN